MFLAPYIALTVLLTDWRNRVRAHAQRDDGAVTLEQAIITSALVGAALTVCALIGKAILSHADNIR